MAMPRKINIQFGEVFPHGVYAVSEVTQVRDFDRSTKDRPVYSVDEDSGLNVWSVDVMDGDPEARKADRQLSIKILSTQKPVLPSSNGLPFTPVEFDGLTATPYVAENGGRPRLAWSFRATGVRAPKNAPGQNKPAA
ncbi:plasmid replication, integration and excision activator [Kribbella sp. NPDC049584]|uniref:plasmid replication, integration and excision activator n=1 Tax=Kribbella sp. NPDC049584 TaxID=3154833 RepID=UPI003437A270